VATQYELARIAPDGTIDRTPLGSEAEVAFVSETLVAVGNATRTSIYARDNLQLVGTVETNTVTGLSLALANGTLDLYRDEGRLRAYAVTDRWTLDSFEAPMPRTSAALRFRRGWTRELPARTGQRWFSFRRLIRPNVLFVLAGDYSNDAPVLQQLDGRTGEPIEAFPSPEGGWPQNIFEILDVVPLADDRVSIAMRHYPAGVSLGVWEASNGRLLRWRFRSDLEVGGTSDFLGFRSLNDSAELHLALQQGDEVIVLDATSGDTVWRGPRRSHLAAPPLSQHPDSGAWSVSAPEVYDRVARIIGSGGGDLASHITRVELPREERERISKLSGLLGAHLPANAQPSGETGSALP
jgi:hypothetical protein